MNKVISIFKSKGTQSNSFECFFAFKNHPTIKSVQKGTEKVMSEIVADIKKNNFYQEQRFEIINKNGAWIFAPVQQKKETNIMNLKKQNSFGQFITLPDGSKIERGL